MSAKRAVVLGMLITACGGETVSGPVPAPVPTQITSDALSLTLRLGQSRAVSFVPRDAAGNALQTAVTITVEDPGIASVSNGVVTALAVGNTNIVATTGSVTSKIALTVTLVPVSKINVQLSAASAFAGKSVQASAVVLDSADNVLAGRTIIWSSSDATIATVSSTGEVQARSPGSVTISAKAEGVEGSAGFIVLAVPVAKVVIAPTTPILYEHSTRQLSATAQDSVGGALSGRVITWESSNNLVANVSSSGLVTALSAGSATITARSEGKVSSVTFTVRHDPVILVHGFLSSGSIWNYFVPQLQAEGWTDVVAWTYNSLQSNATTATQLKALVDSVMQASGATKVDLVSHSMGGLSTRYYVRNLGGADVVDAFVSLAGPNHGTSTANSCPFTSCVEMRINSSFLASLNSGDETPGVPRYATWWSPCDGTVTPNDSVLLTGAANTQTACLAHSDIPFDETVYRQVRDWIAK